MPETNGALVPAGGPIGIGQRRRIAGLDRVSDAQLGLRPRELRIIHAIRSRNDIGRPGQLRIDQELFDELDVVFVSAQPFRSLSEGAERNRRTVCVSVGDGVPHESVPVPRATECRLCEYGQWDRVSEKPKPPPCQEGFAFIGVQYGAPEARPFYLLCRKTAAIAAKKFLRAINDMPDLNALCELVVRIATQEEQSKTGGLVWYTPVFTVRQRIDIMQYRALSDMAQQALYVPPVDGAAVTGIAEAGEESPPEVDAPQAPAATDDDIPL